MYSSYRVYITSHNPETVTLPHDRDHRISIWRPGRTSGQADKAAILTRPPSPTSRQLVTLPSLPLRPEEMISETIPHDTPTRQTPRNGHLQPNHSAQSLS